MMYSASRKNPSSAIKICQESVLHQIEQEKFQLSKIKHHREIVQNIEGIVAKKDKEISRLRQQVKKYEPSYEKYSEIKLELAQKESANRTLKSQNEFLRRGFQEMIREYDQLSDKLREMERERQTLIRERHGIQRVNRQIEQTFRQYQQQCKTRQAQLIKQLQTIESENKSYLKSFNQLKAYHLANQADTEQIAQLKDKIVNLQGQLAEKGAQLVKNKKMNHQLSVEFDKSVNKIIQFEHELNEYRRDNHELKKTLGLVLQQEKYQKIRQKYVSSARQPHTEEDLSQEDSSDNGDVAQSSPDLSSVRY